MSYWYFNHQSFAKVEIPSNKMVGASQKSRLIKNRIFMKQNGRLIRRNINSPITTFFKPESPNTSLHDQTNYLTENNVLYRYHSGFRKNHSTNLTTQQSLAYLTNKILTGFDSGLLTGMILIDLQKAFDTINHYILL